MTTLLVMAALKIKELISRPKAEFPTTETFIDEDPCSACEKGCAHPQLPATLASKIDYDEPLLGSMKPYSLHLCIIEGSSSQWPERIEEDPTTITSKVMELAQKVTKFRILVSAIDISTTGLHISDAQAQGKGVDILVFPYNVILRGLKLAEIGAVIQDLVNDKIPSGVVVEKLGQKDVVVFVCTHKKRDKRCGVAGPMLIEEFQKAIEEMKGLEYNIHVCGISHTGGHKFAGNLILYGEQTRGEWYGRVKTCHVRPILQKTIIEGKVFKELWRGVMSKNTTENKSW
ncbi:hypothetical protein SmJEL517_g05877 [Synchytrium microbalum]|uniref:Altered inheritance of mitochondria protein 32 n=1 Tax=Synchytrium microbalum TaxID=1806994 RepID=A0A507BSE7_9FUNG|nr:uncharacterized protein SmJEL517_g05877 [Synchytrium microbalum]TPX30592.1 hypothetical protein SmJEL517_g05877 [Synchytrium microbalum]